MEEYQHKNNFKKIILWHEIVCNKQFEYSGEPVEIISK